MAIAIGLVANMDRRLANAKVGRSYKSRLETGKGLKPHTCSFLSGTLPSHLTLDSATGRITGAAVAPASLDLPFRATDSLGGTAQQTATIQSPSHPAK